MTDHLRNVWVESRNQLSPKQEVRRFMAEQPIGQFIDFDVNDPQTPTLTAVSAGWSL